MNKRKNFLKRSLIVLASLAIIFAVPLSARADSLMATVGVGTTPTSFAVNQVTNKIYVTNQGATNSVSVVDGTTNALITTIALGNSPRGITVNPNTNKIYVNNYNANTVSVIDGATDTVTATIPVGTKPIAVDINTQTNKIYVANMTSGDVTIIDGATDTATTVAIGGALYNIVVNEATNKIYASNSTTGDLSVIDGNTGNLTATIVGGGKGYLTINKTTNKIYSITSPNLVKISDGATDTLLTTLTINTGGNLLYKPAINETANKLYIPDITAKKLFIIDGATDTLLTSVAIGALSSPWFASYNPITDKVYVSDRAAAPSLKVIDGSSYAILASLSTGTLPFESAINQSTSKIYLANRNSANVSIYDGSLPAPAITNINPNSGNIGDTITVTGTDFGFIKSNSKVEFNGTLVTDIVSWSNTEIKVKVPAGTTTGNVVVTTNSGASNGFLFTLVIPIPAPTITLLNPTSGYIGDTVTITGTDFGAAQDGSLVSFDGTTAAATLWSDTSVTVTVPDGATTGDVILTTSSGDSNAIIYTVLIPAPAPVTPPPAYTMPTYTPKLVPVPTPPQKPEMPKPTPEQKPNPSQAPVVIYEQSDDIFIVQASALPKFNPKWGIKYPKDRVTWALDHRANIFYAYKEIFNRNPSAEEVNWWLQYSSDIDFIKRSMRRSLEYKALKS